MNRIKCSLRACFIRILAKPQRSVTTRDSNSVETIKTTEKDTQMHCKQTKANANAHQLVWSEKKTEDGLSVVTQHTKEKRENVSVRFYRNLCLVFQLSVSSVCLFPIQTKIFVQPHGRNGAKMCVASQHIEVV